MADPLRGKFFIAYVPEAEQPADASARLVKWTGQVYSRVRDGLYLVRLMDPVLLVGAGRLSFNRQTMVSLDEMRGWDFFDTREDFEDAYTRYSKRTARYFEQGAAR